ncbi:ferredoxin [Amycolatopsis lurida]|uniref:ferredoxin n=1 Tax=Amycolatopsis sp. YIM 10 TaxID=2653857 RepID=UPI00128FFFE0|nr:ferredoxin [Amycolatopsis sp. YIM 10]QFU91995.1 Ferredoxin [Amycolatopsis sp. YIM 10]
MKIVVDWNRCAGIGMCESLVPDVFEVDEDGQMNLLTEEIPDGQEAQAREAVSACPNEALSLED